MCRAIANGLYFPLEEIFRDLVRSNLDSQSIFKPWGTLIAGTLAGSSYGFLMNPISSIKYHYWGRAECGKENFLSTAIGMYRQGGFKLFFVGTTATVLRDLIFGGVFSLLRHDILISKSTDNNRSSRSKRDRMNAFAIDVISASTATVLSSPLNYVRDMHYSMSVKPKSIFRQLCSLWEESMLEKTTFHQCVLLQRKLRIGWGTARVGCGMAFGSFFYTLCSR